MIPCLLTYVEGLGGDLGLCVCSSKREMRSWDDFSTRMTAAHGGFELSLGWQVKAASDDNWDIESIKDKVM